MIPNDIANLIHKQPKTDEEYNTLNDFLSSEHQMSCPEFINTVRVITEHLKSEKSLSLAYHFLESQLKIFERDYSAHLTQKLLLLYDISRLCYERNDYKSFKDYVYKYYFCSVAKEYTGNVNTEMGFYCFKGFSKYSLDDIANETISAVQPRMFNDPLDTLLDWWIACNINKSESNFDTHFAIMLKKANEHLKVRCLIGDQDNGHTKNIEQLPILMWSHYADSHKGFCVKYEFPIEMFQGYEKNVKKLRFIHPISYDFNHISLEVVPGMKEGLFTKSQDWSYENEMRFINLDFSDDEESKKEYPILSCKGAIKEIYLGVRCSDSDQRAVEKAIADKNVKLFKMQIDKNNPTKLIKVRIG